ncbi:MAG: Uncharacterised protein [Flavobacterium sp. SCGC AAA160-P02]|nr:MAG: Uncharacterised protein [Flavobacterium sp. SCGC AAA160-P02]
MKNVSILGCGWLGKPLAISMLDKGYLVKGSSTSNTNYKEFKALDIEPYVIDISATKDFDSFLSSEILIITITSKDIGAFKHLIEQIERSSVQKVIFISSTSVYPMSNTIVSEETETIKSPLSEIENLFRKNSYFKTTIIRFAGLFGPGRHPGTWFKNNVKIPQPKGYVNLIHQEDCIKIIQKVITENYWNHTLNACSNHHPTREDFYTNARNKINAESPVFEEKTDVKYKIISSQKLQKVLHYQFIHDNLMEV